MDVKLFIIMLVLVFGLVYGATQYFSGGAQTLSTISPSAPSLQGERAVLENGVQKISLRALQTGVYDKRVIIVKKGIPVELTFSADERAGCGHQLVLRNFNINVVIGRGESKTISFTPNEAGNFEYACGMRMFRGTLVVEA